MTTRKTSVRTWAMLLCSWWVFAAAVADAQENKSPTAYQALLAKLETLTPGQTIEVTLGTGKDTYLLGETFEARFRANKACYVVLMHISSPEVDSAGTVLKYGDITFLLPNGQFRDNKIEEGRVYSTAEDFNLAIRTALPTGFDTLNLFCMAEKLDLFDADFEKAPIYQIAADDDAQLRKLAERLELLKTQEWTGASASFLVQQEGAQVRALPRKFGALPPPKATGTTGKQ